MNSKRIQISLLLCGLVAIPGYAQSPSTATQSPSATVQDAGAPEDNNKSLGEIAKNLKKKTAAQSHVITEEDLAKKDGPLPKLEIDDDDNSIDILDAIVKYKSTHSPEETEDVVRSWYDHYNDMLSAALRDNKRTMQLNQLVSENGYYGCHTPENYQSCQQQMIAQQRIARSDQADNADNNRTISRIRQELQEIHSGLLRYNIQYSWFKIRNNYY